MISNRLAAPGLSLLLATAAASVASAATPVIGMASAQSGAFVDDMKVSGNATVFEGSRLQSSGYSRVHLNNGARLDLAAGSRVQVFANRVSLEQGMSEVQSSTGYEIDARTLKIQPTDASSIARVRLDGDKQVLVLALNSPVNVLNKEGMLVARVSPGAPLAFLPQAAGAGAPPTTPTAGAGAGTTAGLSTTTWVIIGISAATAASLGGAAAAGAFSSNSP